MTRTLILSLMAAGLLTACERALPVTGPGAPVVARSGAEAPAGAAPGTCWGKVVTPAVIETVTDQVLERPAGIGDDGTPKRPATYRTETRQKIVEERRVTWFETPCPEIRTPDFVASLQRALSARGHYHGPVTGRMDARTRAAVRRYQATDGPESGILSLASARRLGLVAIPTPKDQARGITS